MLSCLKIYFKNVYTQQSSAMCVYSSWCRDRVEYMHIATLNKVHNWNKFQHFRFRLNFQISKLDLRF